MPVKASDIIRKGSVDCSESLELGKWVFFLWSSQQRGTEFPVFPLVGPSKFKYNSIDAGLIDSGWPIERKPSGPACYRLTHQESLMAKI